MYWTVPSTTLSWMRRVAMLLTQWVIRIEASSPRAANQECQESDSRLGLQEILTFRRHLLKIAVIVRLTLWGPDSVRLGSMAHTTAVSAKPRHFRSLVAAIMVAFIAFISFGQQAHAHAGPHSEDHSAATSLLDANADEKSEAAPVCCHGGSIGVACAFGALSGSDRGLLVYLPQISAGPLPANSIWCASLAHAPPNPPPISLRF